MSFKQLIPVFAVILIFSVSLVFSSDDHLILTKYIKSKQIDVARNLSAVRSLPNAPKFESYSGFITVDEKYDSNLFFWFIPSQVNSNNLSW